jgi:hypothetical protein
MAIITPHNRPSTSIGTPTAAWIPACSASVAAIPPGTLA